MLRVEHIAVMFLCHVEHLAAHDVTFRYFPFSTEKDENRRTRLVKLAVVHVSLEMQK